MFALGSNLDLVPSYLLPSWCFIILSTIVLVSKVLNLLQNNPCKGNEPQSPQDIYNWVFVYSISAWDGQFDCGSIIVWNKINQPLCSMKKSSGKVVFENRKYNFEVPSIILAKSVQQSRCNQFGNHCLNGFVERRPPSMLETRNNRCQH